MSPYCNSQNKIDAPKPRYSFEIYNCFYGYEQEDKGIETKEWKRILVSSYQSYNFSNQII